MEKNSAFGAESDFAEQLNALFEQWQIDNGQLLTNREVAELATAAGFPMSASYLSQLRSGARDNPSSAVLAGLARVFHACRDPAPTLVGAAAAARDNQMIAAVANARLRRLLRLASGLSEPACDILITFSDKLRRVEGLLVDTTESLASLLRTLARGTTEPDERESPCRRKESGPQE
ncbi:transcriptional regulator [Nocardia brasiliensis]|uniref:transcriptional regulator n=1 Tax=Nocardia brasiliensis TaxID=37326 RepID=UPI003D8D052A